jgi:tagatose-1,6-bisphosphate aldolase non-catalytic subunit AgaZ/GatZ
MEQNLSRLDHLAAAGPAVDVHGRVVTANRQAAALYRQAQNATDSVLAATALRLAVNADPAFGLAVADLDAITGTASPGPSHHQMNWERHHIEVVHAAVTGNARRAADLLREHLASVGCDPLAYRIAALLRQPAGKNDDFENLASQLPGCHTTRWPCPP